MVKRIWDVIVVGGGPAGSAAAKKCAEHGLETLILEKQKLPRHKVCTGNLMGAMTQNIVKEVFGEVPREVLTTPSHIDGYIVYSPGYEGRKTEHRMPLAWRYDLDYWMNKGAKRAGSELWEESLASKVVEDTNECKVSVQKEGKELDLNAKYVIGADGGNSVVRKSIFQEFIPHYVRCFQEVHKVKVNLSTNYLHWYILLPDRHLFEVHHKTWQGDQVLVVDSGSRPDEVVRGKEIMDRVKKNLAEICGFDLKSKTLWFEGCVDAMWFREIFSTFFPARGKVLLIGDASGIRFPVTAEGIGTGIRCGLMAADAIKKAIDKQGAADSLYLDEAQILYRDLAKLAPPRGYLAEQARKGADYLLDAYKKIYDEALKY